MNPTGIIVIEGPDAAGKTTLADYFVREYGAHKMHQGLSDDMWTYHLGVLREAVQRSLRELVVLDRLWLSEAIYARVYRGGTRWPHEGRLFDRMLLRHCAVNVVCVDRDVDVMKRQFASARKERTEMYEFDQRIVDVMTGFRDVALGGVTGPEIPSPYTYADDVRVAGGCFSRRDWLQYERARDGVNVPAFAERVLELIDERKRRQLTTAYEHVDDGFFGHLHDARAVLISDAPFADDYDFANESSATDSLHMAASSEHKFMWVRRDRLGMVDIARSYRPQLVVFDVDRVEPALLVRAVQLI